ALVSTAGSGMPSCVFRLFTGRWPFDPAGDPALPSASITRPSPSDQSDRPPNGRTIPAIEIATGDGYTTRGGPGLALDGAGRLVSDFSIHSRPWEGTQVTVVRRKEVPAAPSSAKPQAANPGRFWSLGIGHSQGGEHAREKDLHDPDRR